MTIIKLQYWALKLDRPNFCVRSKWNRIELTIIELNLIFRGVSKTI